jgi:6-phosphogluconolactonase (cycloisomerase 2 family)
MKRTLVIVGAHFAILFSASSFAAAAEFLIVGVDTKVKFTAKGIEKIQPGKDLIILFDIGTDPLAPKALAEIPMDNSVFGPPTNIAVSPNGKLAIVANSLNWKRNGDNWDSIPDDRIFMIDLTSGTPHTVGNVDSGGQPSGIAISHDGNWVAVANRASKSISLFSVRENRLVPQDSIDVNGEAAAVAFTPDNRRVLVTKFAEHAVAVLDLEGGRLVYDSKSDLAVGRWPYNVQITPDGSMALVANNGNNGMPDGHVDTVSVIELNSATPHVVDHVVVGDGPEGLAVSPDGKLALVSLLQGSAPQFENSWFHNPKGAIAVLEIDGMEVRKIDEIKVGRFPEGVGFSKDGHFAYVGDLLDSRVSILNVENSRVTNTGRTIPLTGQPASLRTQLP